MRYLLALMLLPGIVAAELPQQIPDTAIMENEEFILNKIVRLDILANQVPASSSTLFGATTNSTSFVCLAGSTVTLTVQANSRVLINWAGIPTSDVGQATYFVTAYDGTNCVNSASGQGYYSINTTGVGYNSAVMSATCLTPALSAGVHGFCVNAKVSGGGANGIYTETGFLSAIEIR